MKVILVDSLKNYFIYYGKNKKKVPLKIQRKTIDQISSALKYIKQYGQTLNASYPYTAKDGQCQGKKGDFHINDVFQTKGCD